MFVSFKDGLAKRHRLRVGAQDAGRRYATHSTLAEPTPLDVLELRTV
jgi:hypothetical protein